MHRIFCLRIISIHHFWIYFKLNLLSLYSRGQKREGIRSHLQYLFMHIENCKPITLKMLRINFNKMRMRENRNTNDSIEHFFVYIVRF